MDDTIVGISTALGKGAISIIRVSGNLAIKTVNNIFKGKNLEKVESHTIHYGFIKENKNIIDEVLISVMKEPRTFTKEDVVEINCHGGVAPTNKILELLLKKGCRLAEPGEFTKRAFLNGRIDLIEANGVMEMINSKTEQAMDLALTQIKGRVSFLINKLREDILKLITNIEVNIDYPEYEDILELTKEELKIKIKEIKKQIEKILKESQNGKIIKEGIKTSIIGKPNVGKSSILNKLIDEEKAIVSNIPGTTRDIVEGVLNIDGLMLNIVDTAGIRLTDDVVEKLGVEKSYKVIEESDLILFVLNNNEEITKMEKEILEKIVNKPYIIIINKIDLNNKLNEKKLPQDNIVYFSATKGIGYKKLIIKIKEIYNLDKIKVKDLTYVASAYNISILKEILHILEDVEKGLENNLYIDMIEIDLKNIWIKLGQIIGETYEEEIINEMFKEFCLGK